MILVTNGYRGRPSNEQFIAPGTYANNDPRLFGLASYLIENGFAYALDEGLMPTNEGGDDPESNATVEQIELPEPPQVEDEGDQLSGRRQSPRNRRND